MCKKTKQINEDKYLQLINHLPTGFALHEIICNEKGEPVDYRFLEVNPAFEILTGLKSEDIVGRTCLEVLPETEQIWIQRYGKVAITGKTDHFEIYNKEIGRYFKVTVFSITKNHFACLFHDITEHVKLKNTLKASEQDLKEAQEIANIGHWKLDVVKNTLEWSDEIFKIFEIDKEEFEPSYEAFLETIHPDDREIVNEAYTRSLKNKLPYDIEHRLLMKDGRIKWVNEICRSKFDKNGNPLRSVGIVQDITELKIAAEQTEKNIESLRLSESLTGIGYFERNWQTGEGYWSEGFYRLLGESPENVDCTHAEFMKYVHKDDQKRVTKHVQGTIKDHTDMDIEFRIVQVGGNTIDIHGRGTNIYDETGSPLTTIGTFLDITKAKKAQETLIESEEKFRSYIDNAPDGVFVADEKGRYVDVNKASELITGYSRKELLSMSIPDLLPPESVEKGVEHFKSTEKSGNKTFESIYLHKSGEKRWWSVDAVKISEKRFLGFVKDITERKKGEEAIKKSNDLLKSVINQAPFAIHILEGDFNHIRPVMENMESVRIMGEAISRKNINADRKEDLKTRFFTIDGQEEIPLSEMPGTRAFKGDISTNREILFRHADGTEIMVQASAAPIYGSNGEIKAVIVVFYDITEKYKLENYLQKSQKLESLGILAGGIAHDFNNILSAIFGFTELAITKTSEKETSTYLKKSIQNIERARSLTQQLLTFAKGGIPVKKTDDLFPFIRETVQFALSGSSVTSKFHIQEHLWQCNFDKNQIGQVIDNLTINAKQAMSDGGTIEISAENITVSEKNHPFLVQGKYVKLSIKDAGIGIPREFLQRIFDPYYTTKPKGHGLGLATCYSIISKHDGYIDAESEPGKGSIFSIYLPATTDSVANKNPAPEIIHRGEGTFIVMDDEEPIREIINDMLISFGYDVVLKKDGKEIIDFLKEEIAQNKKIAGMIFDLTVPGGMGGKETIKKARELYPDIPVFVASGYSEDPIISNPENFGFNASIRKPFMIADLSEILERHMKKS